MTAIENYVVNPVEARLASLDPFATLETKYEIPTEVAVIDGFRAMDEAALEAFLAEQGLAMDMKRTFSCSSTRSRPATAAPVRFTPGSSTTSSRTS